MIKNLIAKYFRMQVRDMTKTIKKFVGLVMALALLTGLLAGCSNNGGNNSDDNESADGVVNIDFWGGWNGSDLGVMEEIVEQFNNSQDNVHVTLTTFSWSDMFSKLVTEYADGVPCDILGLHPFEIGQYAEMGLYNPEPVAELGLDESDYSEVVWDATFYDGVQYAVPLDSHMHGVFYNKALFEEYGITKVPETGDELVETAIQLTVDANGLHPDETGFDPDNIVQYGLGMGMNHHLLFQFQTLMCQQGEEPFTVDMTEADFDDEKAEKAFTWLQDLVFKYHVAPLGETSYSDDFVNGTVAMAIGGSWDVPKIQSSDIDWGVTLYPQVFDGERAYWAAAHMLVFPSSKNPDKDKVDAAVQFASWLTENLQLWADAGYVPSSKQMESYVAQDENISVWLEAMDYAHYMPAHPKASQLFNQSAPSPFVTAYSSLILDGEDPAEVVRQFKADLNQILQE